MKVAQFSEIEQCSVFLNDSSLQCSKPVCHSESAYSQRTANFQNRLSRIRTKMRNNQKILCFHENKKAEQDNKSNPENCERFSEKWKELSGLLKDLQKNGENRKDFQKKRKIFICFFFHSGGEWDAGWEEE